MIVHRHACRMHVSPLAGRFETSRGEVSRWCDFIFNAGPLAYLSSALVCFQTSRRLSFIFSTRPLAYLSPALVYFQCQTRCIPLAGSRLFSVPDSLHTSRRLSFIFSARLLTFHGLRNARAEALINEGLLVRDFFITECDKEMTPR